MGRMKSIWGEDSMEFKPERWILKNGGIKREPSYKFAAFGSGPRACVVECHPVLPQDSVVLQMKHGLKVRLTKRSKLKQYPSE
ncbi:alkane hydroxylase MAH1-like protein [Tanacetum coccineum]